MIKRPSGKDSENDILQMQQNFFAESNRDANFQPAAKVVRIDQETDGKDPATEKAPRKSEFAKKRNLKKPEEPKSVVPENTIIGDIVEKRYSKAMPMEVGESRDSDALESFPKLVPLTVLPGVAGGQKRSLFAQMFNKGEEPKQESKEVKFQLPIKSVILEGEDVQDIHQENLQKIGEMSEEDILKEREQLVGTMDPKLVEFLKARKKGGSASQKPKPEPIQEIEELKQEIPDLDVMQQEGSDQWINFDILEPEKLEWTKNIQKSVKELKPGEKFEARFDWKGVLQPYVAKEEGPQKDDRELYLHGEDAERPGYTLQELFRLARANVLQQRISALNAIGGILNIYNQGFYDGVLDLPVSKIFFFLRFALDENTPAVVEAASRALAYLFYNDTDETLVDAIFDTERGIFQPQLGLDVTHSRSEEEEQQQMDLETGFDSLKLTEKKGKAKQPNNVHFAAHIDDDPDDINNRETMNDFHLAETDLLECLLRTNILERIRYILFSMRPEGTTAISCTKILIRMARTNPSMAVKIAGNEQLVRGLIRNYLSANDGPGKHEPQHLVIKLLRVLCANGNDFYERFFGRHHVVSLLKRFVFSRRDINVKMIQIQIETFRFMRLVLKCTLSDELYCELLPALFYLLEWHFQHLVMDETGPFIIRQHCAALLALIGYDRLQGGAASAGFTPQNCDRLFACFSKWFNAATKYGVNEFSQKLLLGACLNVASKVRPLAGSFYRNFVVDYLTVFLKSAKFDELVKQLMNSPLFNTSSAGEDRSAKIAPLPNMGGIVTVENHPTAPTLILVKTYPVFLLQALLDFLRAHAHQDQAPLTRFIGHTFHFNYLTKLAATVSVQSHKDSKLATVSDTSKVATNWFLKAEQYYIVDLLAVLVASRRQRGKSFASDNSQESPQDQPDGELNSTLPSGKCDDVRLLLAVAFRVIILLSEEFYPVLVKLFDEVVFVREFYVIQDGSVSAEDLQRWKFNYKVKLKSLVQNAANLVCPRNSFTIVEWHTPLLAPTWPYSLLYLLLEKLEQGKPRLQYFSEEQIIRTSLLFSELVENNGICLTTVTQKLMYLMTAFLGPDSKFLEAELSALITRRIDALREEVARGGEKFDFDARLEDSKSYHGLYQLVLDIFQSSSYGHAPFSSLVMVPLAQSYDIRWRNMVWSEHVAVLRFITCSEQQV